MLMIYNRHFRFQREKTYSSGCRILNCRNKTSSKAFNCVTPEIWPRGRETAATSSPLEHCTIFSACKYVRCFFCPAEKWRRRENELKENAQVRIYLFIINLSSTRRRSLNRRRTCAVSLPSCLDV